MKCAGQINHFGKFSFISPQSHTEAHREIKINLLRDKDDQQHAEFFQFVKAQHYVVFSYHATDLINIMLCVPLCDSVVKNIMKLTSPCINGSELEEHL